MADAFVKIEVGILDELLPKIKPAGLAVFAVIKRHMNRKTGDCYPSIATIARLTDLTKKTVRKYIAILEQYGLIEKHLMPPRPYRSIFQFDILTRWKRDYCDKVSYPWEEENSSSREVKIPLQREAITTNPEVSYPEEVTNKISAQMCTDQEAGRTQTQKDCKHLEVMTFADESTICAACFLLITEESQSATSLD